MMSWEALNKVFRLPAAKKELAQGEVDPRISNQHEFNGTRPIREFLGETPFYEREATFLYLGIDEHESWSEDTKVSWYDARQGNPARRPEWRLYYKSSEITRKAKPGDWLLITTFRNTDRILLLVVARNGFWEKDVLHLFTSRGKPEINNPLVPFLLDQLGLPVQEEEDCIDGELLAFLDNGEFPEASLLSEKAREKSQANPEENPDQALLSYLDTEFRIFKTLEKIEVEKRLQKGFSSVEEFIQYSLSVQNRRKARAGLAMERHLESIFRANSLKFSRNPITELKKRPDFIFPAIQCYRKREFPAKYLTHLGAKTSVKERWRQVVTEADRIEQKHLCTLDTSISEDQLKEMSSLHVKLVIPAPSLSQGYSENIISLHEFILQTLKKQKAAAAKFPCAK